MKRMKNIKILLVALLMTGTLYAAEKKVVIDLTSGDVDVVEKALVKNLVSIAEHYKANGDTLKAVVVISGKSYRFFVHDLKNSPYQGKMKVSRAQKRLAPKLEMLSQRYGVDFRMCQAGMKVRKIAPQTLYRYVKHDRNKSIYLIDYQNEGYAYLSVH